jgi:hypothetical protein
VNDRVAEVRTLAELTRRLAAAAGRTDLADLIRDTEAARPVGATTVVVAGGQKRGKSRLLNALVEQVDLLPVDVDVATGVEIVLRSGPELRIEVDRIGPDGPITHPIERADLAHHASVLGDPARREGVSRVRIAVPHPVLDGLNLVDTPGVDGLTLGHRHATLAAISNADVLLFTVSAADQPVLRHELEFLAAAADRLQAVAFVATKTEDSTAATELLEENRDRLRRFVADRRAADEIAVSTAERLLSAPWFPVSAVLAEAAQELTDLGRADRAVDRARRSGLPTLRAYLRDSATDREQVRAGALLALTASVLRTLDVEVEDRLVGVGGGDAVPIRIAEIDEASAHLTALQLQRHQRSTEHQFFGQDLAHWVRVRLGDHRRGYEAEIDALRSSRQVTAYATELPTSIERTLSAVWTELGVEAERLVGTALQDYVCALGLDTAQLSGVAWRERTMLIDDAPLSGQNGQPRLDVIGEALPATMMAGAIGFMSANLVPAALLVGAAGAAPFALGAALAATFLVHRRRVAALTRTQQGLLKGVAEVFVRATGELGLAAQRAVTTWRGEAERLVEAYIQAEQRELKRRRDRLARDRRRATEQRKRVAADATRQRRSITDALARAAELAARPAPELAVDAVDLQEAPGGSAAAPPSSGQGTDSRTR